MSNLRFGIVVVVLIGKPPLMGEVLCSTENSPFLIIDHIHAKINRVCCAALAIGKECMNVRKSKLFLVTCTFIIFPAFLLIRNHIHIPMNKIQNREELLFIRQNGCSFGFGRLEAHRKLKQGSS